MAAHNVYNGKPAETKTNVFFFREIKTFIVGAPVSKGLGHGSYVFFLNGPAI